MAATCTQTKLRSVLALCPVPEHYSSAPLERFVCLLFVQGYGGGLFIMGTATLIDMAIYQNEAMVCSASEPT